MFDKMVMEKFYRQAKTPRDLPWHRDEPETILKEVLASRNGRGRLLDIGCGAGTFSVHAAKLGYEVTGLDMISRALEFGRSRAASEGVKVEWVETDLLKWKPAKSFDIILDSGCLHSLIGGDLQTYRDRIVSWLASGGDFVLGHWGKRNLLDWRPIGPRRRSRAALEKLFEPELRLEKCVEELMTGVPLPFGPTILGLGLWFKKKN